jgi:two-component system chemotaxis response regulator CheB
MEKFRNIIVIGASAGGLPAIREVISRFPGNMDAAVFVVLHVSKKSNGQTLAKIFQKHTSLQCIVPTDGTIIQKGHFYLAPPDHQMIIKGNTIKINQGARENKYRPSIDVLFRSAAVNYGSRVIGIILTGLLDDGTSGMSAIKRCGGICIIQDPSEAMFADMPQSVINLLQVDYQVGLSEMGGVLENIFNTPIPPEIPIPRELQIEAEITVKMMSDINDLKKIGDHSDFTCPECGGGLWTIKNDPTHRYRCHTGHVYTENVLYETQGDNLEESVWVSIRMLEERRNLLLLMATHAEQADNIALSLENRSRSDQMNKHIERLKIILSKLTEDMAFGDEGMNVP